MQQYLTLDEAASRLHISPDELREMAKKKTIRAFQDRGSWRFRTQDIEELARSRGLGSDPELQLGEASKTPAPSKSHASSKAAPSAKKPAADAPIPLLPDDDDAVPLGREKFGDKGPRSSISGKSSKNLPKSGSDSDVRLVLDHDFQNLPEPARPESSGPKSTGRKSKLGKDSGVRLNPADEPSDSDVRLDEIERPARGGKRPTDTSESDVRLHDLPSSSGKKGAPGPITEEIDLDAEASKQAEKPPHKGGKPKATMMANPSMLPTSSPFELSDPDVGLTSPKKPRKSEVDSSSDFELVPFDQSKAPAPGSSDDIPLLTGDEEINFAADVAGPKAGASGINLQDPGDSGISLESGGSDEIDFELSLDSGVTPKPAASKSGPKSGPKSAPGKAVDEDSSSEFELSLDDSDQDSSSSEFELSLDDSDDSSVQEASDSEFELTLDEAGGLQAEDEAQDIFEETDFNVPALEESGSEAVALDDGDTDMESSEFDISLDESGEESGSQVVALEDEDQAEEGAATIARPRKQKAAAVEEADESSEEFDVDEQAPPKKGKGKKKPAVEVDEDEEDEDDLEAVAPAAEADWGAMPAVFLFPTVAVLFLVGIMGFEVLRGMWGYQRPSPVGKPVIDAIARQFDDSLPK
ncbi:MAG: helix-turn-helix domain-containing protein [Gemmataceae bacterium]